LVPGDNTGEKMKQQAVVPYLALNYCTYNQEFKYSHYLVPGENSGQKHGSQGGSKADTHDTDTEFKGL
jgi:hypothetical protein